MQKEHSKHGFTLIEVLVVVGIIGLLSTVVLIAVNPARQFATAHNAQRSANIHTLLNSIGQYTVDHQGKLPDKADDKNTETFVPIAKGGADICAVLVPVYLPALPIDPRTGGTITDCSSDYDTGYTINVDAHGYVTITAPHAELAAVIEAIR
jgi:prepilin-type N-terminal cleavage/methylation domain-containing protein